MAFNNVSSKAIATCPPLCKLFNQFFFFLKISHLNWIDLFLIMWHLNHNKIKSKLSIKKRTDCLVFYIFVCESNMYISPISSISPIHTFEHVQKRQFTWHSIMFLAKQLSHVLLFANHSINFLSFLK